MGTWVQLCHMFHDPNLTERAVSQVIDEFDWVSDACNASM